MSLPTSVRIVEVGPHDGLQNEKQSINVADKVHLVELAERVTLEELNIATGCQILAD